MSIAIHKAGINQTLGQQSDAIYPTGLVGDFQPHNQIATEYWTNQVSGGENLRRYNSITHNNSTPHNWEFDGTDDYLGPASTNYGGAALTIAQDSAWTVGVWWRYDNSGDNWVFGLGEYDALGNALKIESSDHGVELIIENPTTLSSLSTSTKGSTSGRPI